MTYIDNTQNDRPTTGRRWILWLAAIAAVVLLLVALVKVALFAYMTFNPSTAGGEGRQTSLFVQLDPVYVQAKDVTRLEVVGGASRVTIQPYHDNERSGFVRITEGYLDDGSDRRRLMWTVEDGTLRIDDNEYGLTMKSEKLVTIELPSDVVKRLEQVFVECSSGDVTMSGIDCAALNLKASSGSVHVNESRADALELKVSSGNADIDVAFNTASFEVSSGSIDVRVQGEPERIACDVTSGEACISLPKGLGFTPNVSEESGEVTIHQPLDYTDDVPAYGDGHVQLELSVSSGHIDVIEG